MKLPYLRNNLHTFFVSVSSSILSFFFSYSSFLYLNNKNKNKNNNNNKNINNNNKLYFKILKAIKYFNVKQIDRNYITRLKHIFALVRLVKHSYILRKAGQSFFNFKVSLANVCCRSINNNNTNNNNNYNNNNNKYFESFPPVSMLLQNYVEKLITISILTINIKYHLNIYIMKIKVEKAAWGV